MMIKLLEAIAHWLTRRGRREVLSNIRSGDVLHRHFLIFWPKSRWLGLGNLYLHHVVGADVYEHNHGRWCVSLVLCGRYVEESGGIEIERRRFSLAIYSPMKRHRISRSDPGTWTLFLHGPRTHEKWFSLNGKRIRSRSGAAYNRLVRRTAR